MFIGCEIVNHGVPQRAVLGQLIFLLYVNDFSPKIDTTEKVINSQMTKLLYVVDGKVAYMEKSRKFYKKQKNM